MACATIAERGVSTAIVANRAELATQWRERLTEFLDIDPKHIGQLGAGRRKRTGIIDIITMQSIARKDADLLQGPRYPTGRARNTPRP